MPNRIVRDSILASEAVCSLDWAAEVFYRRLMSIADDYGRCEAMPQLLRARCYPLQTDAIKIENILAWLAACREAKLIRLYSVGGKNYLEINKFGQQIRSASKCPEPPACDGDCKDNDCNCLQPISSAQLGVSVSEGEGVSENTDGPPSGPRVVPCDHEGVIAAYHELCPTLPAVRDWTDKRRSHLQARWREKQDRQNLDWWRKYFRYVNRSAFLRGDATEKNRTRPFRASLDWLLIRDNMAKVIEGRYHEATEESA